MKIRLKYTQKDTETVYVSVKDFLSVYWKWVVAILVAGVYATFGLVYLFTEVF